MINQSTIETLKAMRLTAMAAELEQQLKDSNTYGSLGFEERIGMLVDVEWTKRQTNKLNKLIRNARFALPSATVEGIDYHEDRKLDKAQILRLASCAFIEQGHHIILKGATGNGKSFIACALGNTACRKFKSVRYIRMPELLNELHIAKGMGTFQKVIKSIQKLDLLILDEWLIRTLSESEGYDILEVIEARLSKGSIIFCTQYEKEGWYSRIAPDPERESAVSEAIMDRIIYDSYEVHIHGEISMRERYGLNSSGGDQDV